MGVVVGVGVGPPGVHVQVAVVEFAIELMKLKVSF